MVMSLLLALQLSAPPSTMMLAPVKTNVYINA
jgi:hypothetical protein